MKTKTLFMSMIAGLAFAGCSSEDSVPGGKDGETTTSYMAVDLVSSDVSGTRALSGYEDGTTDENAVSSVRFYFFTDNGAIANVKLMDGDYVNYYDWTPSESDKTNPDLNPGDDISAKLQATIVISTKDGDHLPQRIAAVMNPPAALLGTASLSLEGLKGKVADFAADGLTQKNKFVMFNSVYGGENKKEVCAVPIEAKHLQKTSADAKANPVTIFVERSVAKVSVSLGTAVAAAATEDGIALKDKDGNPILVPAVTGEQVYLKLGGWDLTAETNEGRLVKKINTTGWTSDWWNGSHRSFWAINSEDANNCYYNYEAINTSFGPQSTLYTNENAADFNPDSPIRRTKVILKGTLCKQDGTPFTIVRHLGIHFADTESGTETDNLKELKKSILNQLKAGKYTYFSGDENTRNEIRESDLKIVTVTPTPSEPTDGKARNCYVYAQLTDDAKLKTWYVSSDKENKETVAASVINTNLADNKKVDRALVWKSGMTYYYYEIIHNGSGENATKGVVRNHIYKTTVTGIAGLGTPVYNPKDVIYPEKPDENDHYIAAEIDILSWRIVQNEYNIVW